MKDNNTLPCIQIVDYSAFYEQEKIKFLNGTLWKKTMNSFWQEMKLQVSPNDVDELVRFLRDKRETILKNYEKGRLFPYWKDCFNGDTKQHDVAKFIKVLVIVFDGQIDINDFDAFFSWHCLTEFIDSLLSKTLEQQKSQKGATFNFFYNDGGEIHFGSPSNSVDDDPVEEELLKNVIFNDRLFNSNFKLAKLRDTIAAAIDMDDATIMYGQPQQVRINPMVQSDWYYVVKAIEEAKVAKKFTITGFIDQMTEWFPILFPDETKEQWEKYKRRLSKSISDEKSLWRFGKMKEVVTLREMWAKRKYVRLDQAKMERVYTIAFKGLYTNLTMLKQEIEKENNL